MCIHVYIHSQFHPTRHHRDSPKTVFVCMNIHEYTHIYQNTSMYECSCVYTCTYTVMSTLPDTIELSRVTGLSLQDILFKAEMVKVHSILLRVAHRHPRKYILPSSFVGGQIREGSCVYGRENKKERERA